MEETWRELVRQSPTVAAIVLMAWYFIQQQNTTVEKFLARLKEEGDENAQAQSAWDQSLSKSRDICHEFQREMIARQEASGHRLAAVLDRNAKMLARCEAMLERLEERAKES